MMILSLLLLVLPVHSLASSNPPPPSTTTTTTTTTNNDNDNSMKNIQSVVVVGGTHGNEYTGVWCIKELEQPSVIQRVTTRFPSLKISTLMGNPRAHLLNKRFVDTDLNREFTSKKLQIGNTRTAEGHRAQELNQLLGPKSDPKTDCIVDLHSTTANMGVTLIIPERDAIMAQAAAYVLHKCSSNHPIIVRSSSSSSQQQRRGPSTTKRITEKVRIVMHSIPNRGDRPNLSSVGKHGFTIEVGPVPQGVIRHDGVQKTKQALEAFLEYLELRNQDKASVLEQIQKWYPNGRVPCFRSATAKKPGELSGKIRWPSSEHNQNFPAYMIHKSIQDQDFMLLKTGDPLFVTMEGDVIPYDGSHGEAVYLMFINEGGYYYASSGTGIGVAVETEYNLETADFIDINDIVCAEGDDSDSCSLE